MSRVLFLLAHLHKGGMQRAVSNITQALPPHFESTTAFFGTENPDYRFRGTLCDLELPGEMERSVWQRLKHLAARVLAIRRMVVKLQPDVVVSFGEGAALYNLLSGAPRRVLSVRVSLRESLKDLKPLYRWVYRLLVKFTYCFADAIICNSEQLRCEVEKECCFTGKRQLRVIPNLFDLDEIGQLSAEGLPTAFDAVFQHQVILCVGSLIRQKGQRHLIAAFAQVQSCYPDTRLVFVGQGDDEAQLRQQCEALNLSDRVCFAGHQSNPYAFMSRCRVFVLSSIYEGLPNVLIEAMACGAPVISTDCPTGPREILAPGTKFDGPKDDCVEVAPFGVLLPSLQAESEDEIIRREALLAAAICRLLRDPDLSASLSTKSRLRAADFSVDRIAGKWSELLEEKRNP